jgi:hypothetical protein
LWRSDIGRLAECRQWGVADELFWRRRGCRGNRVGARVWRSLEFVEGNCHIDDMARAGPGCTDPPPRASTISSLCQEHPSWSVNPQASRPCTNTTWQPSNLPNLRRLFVDARSDAEESAYSRKAVCRPHDPPLACLILNCVQSSTILRFSCHPLQSLV